MIEFSCPGCGKKYKVEDQLGGKRAKCKGCGGVIEVPMATASSATPPPPPRATPPAAPAKAPPVRAAAQPPPPPAAAPTAVECPSCGAAMAAAAVLCIECGFDKRTGKRLAGL